MKVILRIAPESFQRLIGHLLREHQSQEEAAFLFAQVGKESATRLDVVELDLLSGDDFESQADDYLELKDQTNARLFKRAHALGACLVECHSHPFPFPAAFSATDIDGLFDTVRTAQWRLRGQPYVALVFAPGGFDALVWLPGDSSPRPLDALVEGERIHRPTNRTVEVWPRVSRGTV